MSEISKVVGFCRVPMWVNGLPAGFCNEPAAGPQEPNQRRYGEYGPGWRGDRWYPGGVWEPEYCSGLACYHHGGPKIAELKPEPTTEVAEVTEAVTAEVSEFQSMNVGGTPPDLE